MFRRMLAIIAVLLVAIPAVAGTWTPNNFIYKPSPGARGEGEKKTFDTGLDRIDARLGKEIWVVDPGYGTTLQSAVTAIGGNQALIKIPAGTWSIGANLTVPANISLKPERGAIFSIGNGVTLTISGALDAGLYQIFSWTGTGAISLANAKIPYTLPQWFGVTADGTDQSAALQKCISSANGAVYFPPGNYGCKNITLASNTRFFGAGSTSKISLLEGNLYDALRIGPNMNNITIDHLLFYGDGLRHANWDTGGRGIRIRTESAGQSNTNIKINNCEFTNLGYGAVRIYGGTSKVWISDNYIHNNGDNANSSGQGIIVGGSVAAVHSVGTGLSDLTPCGDLTGTPGDVYTFKVSTAAATDKFQWKLNDGSWSAEIDMKAMASSGPHVIANGVYVSWAAKTGHTLNDEWTVTLPGQLVKDLNIQNNILVSNGDTGIEIGGYCYNYNITGNRIYNAYRHGVCLYLSSATKTSSRITGNYIEGSGANGIYVTGQGPYGAGSGFLIISNNHLYKNANREWITLINETPTYVDSDTFTVPGDYTASFPAGRYVQATVAAGYVYSTVAGSSYGGGITTVNLTTTVLTNPITQIYTMSNWATDLMSGGINVIYCNDDINISNNIIENPGLHQDFYPLIRTIYSYNMTISGNTFRNETAGGVGAIELCRNQKLIISGNNCTNMPLITHNPMLKGMGSLQNLIVANNLVSSSTYGMYIDDYWGNGSSQPRSIKITGNTLLTSVGKDASKDGIIFMSGQVGGRPPYAQGNLISSNTISGFNNGINLPNQYGNDIIFGGNISDNVINLCNIGIRAQVIRRANLANNFMSDNVVNYQSNYSTECGLSYVTPEGRQVRGLFSGQVLDGNNLKAEWSTYSSGDTKKWTWGRGDIVWFTPTPGGYAGKICTTAGGMHDGTRADNTAYAKYRWIMWTTGTTIWECTTAGTSAGSSPDINGKVVGDTVTDGTVVWTMRATGAAVFKDFGAVAP